MAAQPYDHIDRQMRRSDEIGDQAVAAPEGEMLGLKALAAEIKAARQSWDAVQAMVSSQGRVAAKEGDEASSSMATLRKLFAELAPVLALKAGFQGDALSDLATDDDFFVAVEEMEQVLEEHQGEDWADSMLPKLSALVDAAAKEFTESVEAGRALQKAQAKRAEVAAQTREVFVPFRRCVRGTFGASSKEYRDLLDKRYRKKAPAPTPAS